jgi:hypothetical protein
MESILGGAELVGTKFAEARLGETNLVDLDLSQAEGLEEVLHCGVSLVGSSTHQLSKGKIPEKFLRGCGLSDVVIEYAKMFREGISTKKRMMSCIECMNLRVHQRKNR